MKIRILLLIACATGSYSYAQQNGGDVKASLEQEQVKLKNFAFCSCLIHCYPNDTTILKDGSWWGYFETSGYGGDAFEGIDSLAKISVKGIIQASTIGPWP